MNHDQTTYTRRNFLSMTATVGAALPFTSLVPATMITSPPADARTIHVFSKHLDWLNYQGVAEIAAETGFDGIDLTVRPQGHILPEKVTEDLPKAVEAARKAGVKIEMITTAITDARDPFTEPILKTASKLGIRYYRTGWLSLNESLGVEKSLQQCKTQLSQLAQLNKKYSIHGAYQNHAGTRLGGPVWDLWMVLKDLDPQWIGCQYDIRHATVEGAQSWPLGLDLLKTHIRTLDIKDFKWIEEGGKWKVENMPLGEGMVDFKKYFQLVSKYQLGGPFSLHYEYPVVTEADKNLPEGEKRKKAVTIMKKDLDKLKMMLKEANL